MHTWISTQDEGWWRQTLDLRHIPYTYINTQTAAKEADLRSKYDVILFPPIGRANAQIVINGAPMYGNPIPWKTTELTPNIGKEDSTDDIRPGLGWEGLMHLQQFVRDGGLLITVDDSAEFASQFGMTPGVSTSQSQRLKVVGSILRSKLVDGASPIAYGYGDDLSIYADNPPLFGVSALVGGRGPRGATPKPGRNARPVVARRTIPTWRRASLSRRRRRRIRRSRPGSTRRFRTNNGAMPRTSFRRRNGHGSSCATAMPSDLLVSGLLDGGSDLAQRPW